MRGIAYINGLSGYGYGCGHSDGISGCGNYDDGSFGIGCGCGDAYDYGFHNGCGFGYGYVSGGGYGGGYGGDYGCGCDYGAFRSVRASKR